MEYTISAWLWKHVVEDKDERRRLFKKLRSGSSKAIGGRWSWSCPRWPKIYQAAMAVWTELSYLERHGEEGHLDYARFRRRGVPWAGGAIESAIRRVIKLAAQGQQASVGMKENAEGCLLLRCLVLSHRWDDTFVEIRPVWPATAAWTGPFARPTCQPSWKRRLPSKPPKPQAAATSIPYATAA